MRIFPLAILLGFVLEVVSLIWVGSRLGVLMTLLLLAAGVAAGVVAIRASGLGFVAALQRAQFNGHFTNSDAGVALLWTAAGLLFIVPGFFSDAVGTLLLIPPVSRWLANRLTSGVKAEFTSTRNHSQRNGVVIEGEAVEITGKVGSPHEGYR